MNTYAPPFKLTNTMLDLVASISEKVGRITTGKNLESKPHLRKNNRVKSIYSSLKIEANSLTIGQVRDALLVAQSEELVRNRRIPYPALQERESRGEHLSESIQDLLLSDGSGRVSGD